MPTLPIRGSTSNLQQSWENNTMDAFSFAAEEAFELDHLCFRKIKTKKIRMVLGFTANTGTRIKLSTEQAKTKQTNSY